MQPNCALKMYWFLCVLSKTNHDTRQRARPEITFPLHCHRRRLIYEYAAMVNKDRYRARKRKVNHVVAVLFMTKPGKQSIQTNGLDCKGWHSRWHSPHLSQIADLKSWALQLSNEPSLDQIGQDLPPFRGTFRTYYLKWADTSALSSLTVKCE